jgi:hypothetical protein
MKVVENSKHVRYIIHGVYSETALLYRTGYLQWNVPILWYKVSSTKRPDFGDALKSVKFFLVLIVSCVL